jgi:hypothetical protein
VFLGSVVPQNVWPLSLIAIALHAPYQRRAAKQC